jgi:hypothetical protein
MSTIDYSQRDENVRHSVYASVRKRDGLPYELFANYWRDVHSTLCSRLPGLGFYVQQHFDRDHTANLWPVADGVRRIAAILDGSAELGFASMEDQARFGEASTVLYADERNLFSEAIAYLLPTGSKTFVDREKDGIRNGPDRLHRIHVYMNRKAGTDAARWLEDASTTLADDAAVQKWKVHLPNSTTTRTLLPRHLTSAITSKLTGSAWQSPRWPSKMRAPRTSSLQAAASGNLLDSSHGTSTQLAHIWSPASTPSSATASRPPRVCVAVEQPN